MTITAAHVVRWLPRLLAIAFILFLALFALDVFEEDYSLGELLVGLFMHLLPNFALLLALLVAWRWPGVGGVLFLLLGLVSIFAFNTYRHPMSLLMISGPPFVIGALFLLQSWRARPPQTARP